MERQPQPPIKEQAGTAPQDAEANLTAEAEVTLATLADSYKAKAGTNAAEQAARERELAAVGSALAEWKQIMEEYHRKKNEGTTFPQRWLAERKIERKKQEYLKLKAGYDKRWK